jgi:glycoprotease/Kae1 family metallohydrolase
MYTREEGGMIPVELGKHHARVYRDVIRKAIIDSRISKIDFIAYSRAPGIPDALYKTRDAAREFSKELDIPAIGVNHAIAHLTSGHLFCNVKDPVYLYTSGANTQIIALEGNRFRIFGEALSIAIGNALDKFGREIGLGFPAGPKVEELAKYGKYIELPYVVKGMDVEFSGIITKAIELYKNGASRKDLCFSLQEVLFAMLTEVSERALAHTNKRELLLIGGVAANKRFKEMLEIMCKERNCRCFSVPLSYAGDQAVQIAYQGLLEWHAGRKGDKELEIRPYERADKVDVNFGLSI